MAAGGDIRAGRAFVELFTKGHAQVFKTIGQVGERLKRLAGDAQAAGQRLAGAGAAILSPLGLALRHFAKSAAELQKAGDPRAGAAKQLSESWKAAGRSLKDVEFTIAAQLVPAMVAATRIVLGLSSAVKRWAEQNQGAVKAVAAIGVGLVLCGTALVVFGKVIGVVGSLLSAIAVVGSMAAAAIAFLASQIVPIVVGIGAAALAAYLFRDSLGAIMAGIRGVAGTVMTDLRSAFATFQESWDGIVDAVRAGDLQMAAKIAWEGLRLVWMRGTQSLNELWLKAKYVAIETWTSFKTSLAEIFVSAFATVQTAWINTTSFLSAAWTTLVMEMMNAWNKAQLGVGNLIISAAEAAGANPEFIKAWRDSLSKPLEERIKARSDDAAARHAEINKRQADEMRRIAEAEKGTIGALEEEKLRAMAAMDRAHASEGAARESAIAEAEAALAKLRGEAATKRAAAEARERFGGEARKESVAVTFSGAGLLAMGGGTQKRMADDVRDHKRIAERGAKATERVAARLETVFPLAWG